MKKTVRIFSFISAIIFLIGSIYYSYMLYDCIKLNTYKLELVNMPDGSQQVQSKFDFSSINDVAIASALVLLAMWAMAVLLIIFAFKKKLAILSIIFPVATIVAQVTLKANTLLSEYKFAKYTLNIDPSGDFIMFVAENVKYLPFLLALVSGLVYFVLSTCSTKEKACEKIAAEPATEE